MQKFVSIGIVLLFLVSVLTPMVLGYDSESDWATLEVSMPKNKTININSLFLRFLENHPYMFPILRYILEL